MLKPTATILLDDDLFFIKSVQSLLPKYTYPVVFKNSTFETIKNDEFLLSSGTVLKDININEKGDISRLFNSDDMPVSTLVLDQSMPGKNGLDIFKNIKNNFIQKILISNFFDEEDALQALNEGVINGYLCKMQKRSEFIKNLTNAIYEAQNRFFCNISLVHNNFLSKDNPLLEKETIYLFKTVQEKYSLRYYESTNNCRLFNFFQDTTNDNLHLRIIPEEEIEVFLQSQQSETVPEEVIKLIKDGKMLPCFDGHVVPEGKEWVQYLRPAESLQGYKKYLYSIYWGNTHEHIKSLQ